MNIIDAIHSDEIFKPLFVDLGTWRAWETYLRALFGLGITDPADLELFRNSTGLDEPPTKPSRESFVIAGRRSGKSRMSAVIASYLAGFRDWRLVLAPGETGMIVVVAVDRDQAKVVHGHISEIFARVPCLKVLVKRETKDTIELRNGVTISIKTASYRSIRGFTVIAAILEEMAFWRSDESANPDKEILAAVRPAMLTVKDGLLIGISTPYSRSGLLWEQFRQNFGKAGGPLIWKAATTTMNPTADLETIQNELREDPEKARAEYLCEWRTDIQAFLDEAVLRSVVVPGRHELPPDGSLTYRGFIDPSGGKSDSFTLAIAHKTEERVVVDCVRERRPPFSPDSVVEEFAGVLETYGIGTVTSDAYAGEWPIEAFRVHGIEVEKSPLSASQIYAEFLPMVNSQTVELPDLEKMLRQFVNLERRSRSGSRDLIDHPPGLHDDISNAVAGAAVMSKRADDDGVYIGFSKTDFY